VGAFSSPDWGAVPDVHTDGRSILPYPDLHPEFTAGVWERQKAYRAQKRAELDAKDNTLNHGDDDEDVNSAYKDYYPPTVTKEAEEFDDPCSALATWVKRVVEGGWELVELAHAESISEGKPYGSGDKAGQIRPTRNVDLQWIKAEKEGVGRVLISYPVIDGKVYGTRVSRGFNGSLYGDADMQKILKGEYEATTVD